MGSVTVFTSARMLEIENSCVIGGSVDTLGNLTLSKKDGTDIIAGNIKGPKGDTGEDAAPGSVSPMPNTTPIRTSDSRIKTAEPTQSDDAVTKNYVDQVVVGSNIPNAADLNTYTKTGIYFQDSTAQAAAGSNYPVALAGMLEVQGRVPDGGYVYQKYTPYAGNSKVIWTRAYYSTTGWSDWKQFSSLEDSGWVSVPCNSGYEELGTAEQYLVKIRKINDLVKMRGLVRIVGGAQFAANTEYSTIITIPAGYRPSTAEYLTFSVATGQCPCNGLIVAGGGITIRTGSTAASYVSMHQSWFVG